MKRTTETLQPIPVKDQSGSPILRFWGSTNVPKTASPLLTSGLVATPPSPSPLIPTLSSSPSTVTVSPPPVWAFSAIRENRKKSLGLNYEADISHPTPARP